MKETIQELATGRTKTGDAQGAAQAGFMLEPTIWLDEVIQAAKDRWFFMDFVYQAELQKGQKDLVIPYVKEHLASAGITYATTTPNVDTTITATKIDNIDGIQVTPTLQASRVSLGNYALEVNAVDYVKAAKEELIYSIGDKIDALIATTIGDASSSTSADTGMQILYGGDATSDATLATGDILTTDLIAKAKRLLMTRNKQFRATEGAGGGFGAIQTATSTGNPWQSTPDEPFVFFIGPAQWEALMTNSQFVNAAEFGNRDVVHNGEVAQYLGVKIIVTNNVEQIASGSEGPDSETANAGATMTRCLLVKAKKCCAFVWGYRPRLKVWDNAPEISTDIIMETSYAAKVLYSDAIISVDVTDA